MGSASATRVANPSKRRSAPPDTVGRSRPEKSRNVAKRDGWRRARSNAQYPPSDAPPITHAFRPRMARKFAVIQVVTSVVRYVSACPRPPSTHSVSPVKCPFASGITRIGATPWWVAAHASTATSASAARVQSSGVPGVPDRSSITGSRGRFDANHTGGRYTCAGRAVKRDTAPGIRTKTTSPWRGNGASGRDDSTNDERTSAQLASSCARWPSSAPTVGM